MSSKQGEKLSQNCARINKLNPNMALVAQFLDMSDYQTESHYDLCHLFIFLKYQVMYPYLIR